MVSAKGVSGVLTWVWDVGRRWGRPIALPHQRGPPFLAADRAKFLRWNEPFSTICPGTKRSNFATEPEPWMLGTHEKSLENKPMKRFLLLAAGAWPSSPTAAAHAGPGRALRVAAMPSTPSAPRTPRPRGPVAPQPPPLPPAPRPGSHGRVLRGGTGWHLQGTRGAWGAHGGPRRLTLRWATAFPPGRALPTSGPACASRLVGYY